MRIDRQAQENMTTTEPQTAPILPKGRWYRPTPDRLVIGLLAVEGALMLSEWFRWLPKGYAVLIAVASVAAVMLLMVLWFCAALLFRCWFQFSIRSLLILAVAVAAACSWMRAEVRKAEKQKEVVAAISALEGSVVDDWDIDTETYSLYGPPRSVRRINRVGPQCLSDFLGHAFFARVSQVNLGHRDVTDAGLESVKRLSELEWLDLELTNITDAGLERIKGLSKLRALQLRCTKVTDAGLGQLKGSANCGSWTSATLRSGTLGWNT